MAASNTTRLQRVLLKIAESPDATTTQRLEAATQLTQLLAHKPKRGRPPKGIKIDPGKLLGR